MTIEIDSMSTKGTITVKLPDGTTISGNTSQVMSLLSSLKMDEDGRHYFSKSKAELIPISSMDPIYLKNCILKMYREWLDSIKSLDSSELLKALANGPSAPYLTKPITFKALVGELAKRSLTK